MGRGGWAAIRGAAGIGGLGRARDAAGISGGAGSRGMAGIGGVAGSAGGRPTAHRSAGARPRRSAGVGSIEGRAGGSLGHVSVVLKAAVGTAADGDGSIGRRWLSGGSAAVVSSVAAGPWTAIGSSGAGSAERFCQVV
jgi:hypothetical protein